MPRPILVVDDDPLIVDALSTLLDLNGHAFRTASNGLDALALICTENPQLVFLDLHMPTLDGASVVKELRARGQVVPIVLMSADRDIAKWAIDLDVTAYLPKPFSNADFYLAIERFTAA